ncbi:Ger(x)C family spore germination protein [Paenibacillus sp. J22TS3]|uniref:Ger(x)C family spore germination protein n=1 Tax=Paenibacillus sp. J22TS3 TaxID=2807192 RepID=UPI001B1FCAFB|nr:Ger(x)C family spore germination protein [Paenibacillus sp. J22TS3]GIP23933.1 hypothetical protein J22TS3_42080 [Paenibacillus sp. J22TS3]
MKLKKALFLLLLPLLLGGCWDSKEVQNINFVTAMGIDYVNHNYVVYAQILDFANLSKQEGPSDSPQESALVIGRGEGSSILSAINQLYPTSQQQTLWTHVKAVVLSKSVLDTKLSEVFNGLFRSGEMRYTSWVYGTDEDISSILSSKTLLNHSALSTNLFDPVRGYHQLSYVPPIRVIHLMKGIREPGSTVLLPAISSSNKTWTMNNKLLSLSSMSGLYVISKGKNWGRAEGEQLAGARYVNFDGFKQFPLEINDPVQGKAVVYLTKPKPKVTLAESRGVIHTSIELGITGKINEIDHSSGISKEKIKELCKSKIKQQIIRNFELGKDKDLDLYGLEEILYRRNNKLWKKLPGHEQKPIIRRFELDQVVVNINVEDSNSYNLKLF